MALDLLKRRNQRQFEKRRFGLTPKFPFAPIEVRQPCLKAQVRLGLKNVFQASSFGQPRNSEQPVHRARANPSLFTTTHVARATAQWMLDVCLLIFLMLSLIHTINFFL